MGHYDARTYSVRNSVGYLVRRSASLMREQLEAAFEERGFTFVQWVTLILVRDKTALTPGDLCRDLNHDSGAFTRLLDQLEERGLVQRARSEQDRRVVHLRITAAGRRTVDALLPIVVTRLNESLSDFTAAEVTLLTALLTRLITRLEAGEPARAAPPRTSRP